MQKGWSGRIPALARDDRLVEGSLPENTHPESSGTKLSMQTHRNISAARLNWTLLALFVTVVQLPERVCGDEDTERAPPNVVYIIGDDQGWTDYSFMGHPIIETPHLDRLASQSAFFPRAYVTTSLCRPSLATLISGLYPHQHGITGNDPAVPKSLPKGQRPRRQANYLAACENLIRQIDGSPSLPRILAKHGYRSLQTGKWWEGHFSRGGFTDGMTHGDPKRGGRHGDEGLRIGREGLQPIFDFIDGKRIGSGANPGGVDDDDDNEATRKKRPFFLWYAPFLPHTPHNPPERLLKKYRAEGRPLRLARYYAMCEWFDETCGELLDFLDRRGLSKNTLVVFVCDNGWIQLTEKTTKPKGWHGPFAPRSKQHPHEGGIRTPVLLRWPDRIPPGRRETLVSSIDLAPTVLAACGVPPVKAMTGENLLDTFQDGGLKRSRIFGEIFAHDIADIKDPSKSIVYRWCIEGDWKLILTEDGEVRRYGWTHPRQQREPQLYQLRDDPHETQNLALDHPDLVRRLRQELDAWWKPNSRQ